MPQRFILTMVLALCFGLHAWSQRANTGSCNLAPNVLHEIVSEPSESQQCLPTPEGGKAYVVSWTTRNAEGPTSHLRLVRTNADSIRVLQEIELKDGFASTLEFSRKLAVDEKPFLIVLTQYGAQASEVRIMAQSAVSLHSVFKVLADSVEFVPANDGNLMLAAHNYINGIDVPDLYQFSQGRFVKCNSRYPGYYQKQLSAQHLSADSTISPTLAPQLARLLSLSGDTKGAKRLLESQGQK